MNYESLKHAKTGPYPCEDAQPLEDEVIVNVRDVEKILTEVFQDHCPQCRKEIHEALNLIRAKAVNSPHNARA